MKKQKKLGLCLGAGAARGLAHVGVLKAFVENDIPIDILTGTSMGAVIGGLYAAGTELDFMEKYIQQFEISKFLDFSLKSGGIVKGKRIEDLLKIFTGNKSIEQLTIPFACAAVNIITGEVKNFYEGGLYEAIRASISMPGVFTPYEINGALYMDGGPVERVPITAAKELGADIIIAVDVSWRGQDLPVPKNAIHSMQSALSISGWYIAKERLKQADIVITPDVFKTNPFSAKECDICFSAGCEATTALIPQIKALLKDD